MIGKSLPCWLIQPGPVLLLRFVKNKNEPLVEEVYLIEANPNLLTFASQIAGSPQYQLLIWLRAHPKQLPFRNLILIMMKLRMMSSQPLSLIVLLFITVRDMDLFHQTQLIILFLLATSTDHSNRPNSSDSLLSHPLVQRRSSRNTHPPNRFGNNIHDI